MGRVVVVGSLNEDVVLRTARLPGPGETVGALEHAVLGGGKGGNQAVAAARFGAEVVLVGAVGEDQGGERLRQELAGEGVDVSRVATVEGASGLAVVTVDLAGENQIVVHPGANGHVTAAFAQAALASLELTADDVVICCLEVPLDGVLAGLGAARAAGAPSVLNPSPVSDSVPALYAERPLLVANRHEAAELSGQASPHDAARRLAELCRSDVVVTLGGAGVTGLAGGEPFDVAALAVDVVDTTGAGDALCGVLAASLAAGEHLRTAARWGVLAGALSVQAHGARTGMPRKDDLEAFAARLADGDARL